MSTIPLTLLHLTFWTTSQSSQSHPTCPLPDPYQEPHHWPLHLLGRFPIISQDIAFRSSHLRSLPYRGCMPSKLSLLNGLLFPLIFFVASGPSIAWPSFKIPFTPNWFFTRPLPLMTSFLATVPHFSTYLTLMNRSLPNTMHTPVNLGSLPTSKHLKPFVGA